MSRTPELNESSQIAAWRKEIATEVAAQLRPELERQTAILQKLLETQLSTAEADMTLIAALRKRFGI
jgi:hypothetical protein